MSNCKRSAMTVLYIQDERTKEEGGEERGAKLQEYGKQMKME